MSIRRIDEVWRSSDFGSRLSGVPAWDSFEFPGIEILQAGFQCFALIKCIVISEPAVMNVNSPLS
jgi:hypothetical protein